MIPETLRLRNYLSHRETEIDFKGLHLAVLVGPNGAGKSSLLDAMTWALWGKSRAAEDDELFHHGETFMEVELVFRLPFQNQTEQRYRVLRRRERKGRRSSQTLLDFQVESERGWHSLNGNSVRETQKHIAKHLLLDYDTFINSAYLRQGKADEFLALDPAERKRVLGTILNLESWEGYREKARDRLSEVRARVKELEDRLRLWEVDLQRRPQLQKSLEQAQGALEQATAQLQEVMDQLKELEKVREKARELDILIQQKEQQRRELKARLQDLRDQETKLQTQRQACLELIAQATEIEAAHAAYQAALEEEQGWSARLSQSAQLQETMRAHERAIVQEREALQKKLLEQEKQRQALEKRIEQIQAGLERELSSLEGQVHQLQSRRQKQAEATPVEDVEAQLRDLEALQQRIEEAKATLQGLREEKSRLEATNRQLKEQMEGKKNQLELLTDQATCPLCRQPLSPDHRRELMESITKEGKELGDAYRANRARLEKVEEEARQLRSFIDDNEPRIRKIPALTQHLARLREQREQDERDRAEQEQLEAQAARLRQRLSALDYAQEERHKLEKLQDACAELRQRLEQEDYGHAARAAMAELKDALQALGYDAQAHAASRARIQSLKVSETRRLELEKARVEINGIEARLVLLAQETAQVNQAMAAITETIQSYEAERQALQPVLDQLPRLEASLTQARQQENLRRDDVRRLHQELEALAIVEKRLKEGQAELQALNTRQVILTELQEAFSVKGIPALIIERTLPELERETNALLDRLSHGQMSVQFRTQKTISSGETRETLDLLISDTQGTRSYKLFSGGEQFRINFAVRVALSRLLAQRAGVRLRTLFIDEGFGVLDLDGRERLIEAIRAIQNEFDLLLVITHIEELQDAFPARILVTRDGDGSRVQVV